jgi:putative transposase
MLNIAIFRCVPRFSLVTHYNFIRPHMSLNYKPPVQLPELQTITTLQGKWAKILSLAA